MKICILGAAFDTANMGVSVLAAGALRCALNRFPETELIQMEYGRDGYSFQFSHNGNLREVRFVNIRFSKKLLLRNHIATVLLLALLIRILPFLRNWAVQSNRWLKEMLETDLVLSLAGGDSFSDIYGLRRLVYISLPQILAILTGRKLILLPQTIGPFRYGISRTVARYILRKAHLVYCRDSKSAELSRSLMKLNDTDGKVKVCYDLGFDVDPVKPPAATLAGLKENDFASSPLIGLNVSGLLMAGGYNRANMFGLSINYPELIRKLIDFLITKHSAQVLLVPHTVGSFTESDLATCEILFAELSAVYPGRLGLVRTCEYAETKYAIGRCEFFLGARMHACIGALSQAVPALSLAYSDKFSGVMETIGCGDLVIDLRKMPERDIMTLVDSAFTNRANLKRKLEEKMPQVKQTIRNVLAGIDGSGNPSRPDSATRASTVAPGERL
jgi:colanic acid/amylovoran biosynthesis protein